MGVYYQATQPKIEFYHSLDTNSSTKLYKTFSATSNDTSGKGLQSYSFSRSTKQLVGNFSITVREDTDIGISDKPFLDEVEPFDIVYIYEQDNSLPCFIGIVSNISFGAIASALSKIITISGKSIEYLFDLYKLSLDKATGALINTEARNTVFTDSFAKKKTVKKTKTIEEDVKLAKAETLSEQLNNIMSAFDYKNLELIKTAYEPLSAQNALNHLMSKYEKDYIIGILSWAGGGAAALAKASGYTVRKVNELKKQYKADADKLTEKQKVSKDVEYEEITAEGIDIKSAIYLIIEFLQSDMEKYPDIGTAELYKLLKKFYEIKDNTETKSKNDALKISEMNIDCDISFKYPISSNIYSTSTVKIFEYLKNLLPNNIYEMFGVMRNGKPYIIIREMPFATLQSKKSNVTDKSVSDNQIDNDTYEVNYQCFLDLFKSSYKFPSDIITDYTFSLSNEQVYTKFFGYLEGSALSSEQYVTQQAAERGYEFATSNKDKMMKYGFNILKVNFVGYTKIDTQTEEYKLKNIFKLLDEKLKAWYGNLDELYTGDITVVQVEEKKYPTVGEVCQICDAYFYITNETHSWRYGDVPRINYKLDRGGKYTSTTFEKIKGVSRQFAELTYGDL